MRKFFFFILMIALLTGCNKDIYTEGFVGYTAGFYKAGSAIAKGSYQDFGNYAVFKRKSTQHGWDPVEKNFTFTNISNNCIEKIMIDIKNISLDISDTMKLHFSRNGLSREFPTGAIHFIDADALIETYHLVADADNWAIIDKVNSDSTEVEGRFQMSVITSREEYLNNERVRWDDPNRPNILHFTNGEFRAVFRDY